METDASPACDSPAAAVRLRPRVRKQTQFYSPVVHVSHFTEMAVNFSAIVTQFKGFRHFAECVDFRGTTGWRLSQILRKLFRGLRVDLAQEYVWVIWSEERKSKPHAGWQRLESLSQLKNCETSKLRLYRKPTEPRKRRKVAEPQPPTAPSPPPVEFRNDVAHTAIPLSILRQEKLLTYLMMFVSNPWFYGRKESV